MSEVNGSIILVTGATGFIGSHLTGRLTGSGQRVRCLVRTSSPTVARDYLAHLGAELAFGDLTQPASLAAAVAGATTVFHLGGGGSLGMSEQTARAMNVEGTRNILQASVASGSVRRFVHQSTCGVMGDTHGRAVDETFPCRPEDNVYARTKTEAEQVALSFRDRLVLNVVRFPGVYGPPLVRDDAARVSGVTPLLMILATVQSGQWRYIGDGGSLNDWLYIDDAVEGLRLVAERGAAGETYIISSGAGVSMVQAIEAVARALGVAAPRGHIPVAAARIVAAAAELIARPLRREPPLRREMVDAFLVSRTFDISRARRSLGYEPTVGIDEGMARAVAWYRENGYLRPGVGEGGAGTRATGPTPVN